MLRDLRAEAEVVIDTSGLNVHQLGRKLDPAARRRRGPQLRLALLSFGFKYGVPLDADFVFDMRFLPNPFWVPELQGAHRARRPRSPTGSSAQDGRRRVPRPGRRR